MINSDMQTKQNDMTPEQARAALAWLVEMGADEIVSEAPIDRFQAVAPPSVVAPPVSPNIRPTVPGSAETCMTIADIQRAFLQLEDFPLKRTASNLCFAGGNLAGPIMVMGDVPGRDEDIEGKIFAGSHAILLAKMLGAIGLSMESVGLFNFIPWRPPGNRGVTEAEIAMCQPYVERAIEIVAPKLILSFGQLPMQCLLARKDSLMASRGKWFAYGPRKIPLLASFHPSYLTLQPAQKRLAWRDLLTFKEALDG